MVLEGRFVMVGGGTFGRNMGGFLGLVEVVLVLGSLHKIIWRPSIMGYNG